MKRITKLFTALALALGLTTAASAAEVGDVLTYSNADLYGSRTVGEGKYGDLKLTVPASDELPVGSTFKIKSVKLALRNSQETVEYPYLVFSKGADSSKASNANTTKSATADFCGKYSTTYTFNNTVIGTVGESLTGYLRTGAGGSATGQTTGLAVFAREGGDPQVLQQTNAGTTTHTLIYEVKIEVVSLPTSYTATVSTDTNWSDIEWSEEIEDPSTAVLNLTVENNATITMDGCYSYGTIKVLGDATFVAPDSFYEDGCFSKNLLSGNFSATDTISFGAIKDGYKGQYVQSAKGIALYAQNHEVISINIGGGNETSSTSPAENLVSGSDYYGLYPVPGDSWNNISGQWQSGPKTVTLSSAKSFDGATTEERTSIKLSGTAKNTWRCSSITNPFLRGYLDDGGDGISVEVTGVPYTKYDVIVYVTSDSSSNKLRPIQINDTWYTYNASGELVESQGEHGYDGDVWGAGEVKTPAIGQDAMLITNVVGSTLTVHGYRPNASGGRATVCAVQLISRGELASKDFTANIIDTTTWDDGEGAGLADQSGTWESGELNTITLTNTADEATFTLNGEITAASLKIVCPEGKTLYIEKDADATLNIGGYNLTEAFGDVIFNFDPDLSKVDAGSCLVGIGYDYAGTIKSGFKYLGDNNELTMTTISSGRVVIGGTGTLKGDLDVFGGAEVTVGGNYFSPDDDVRFAVSKGTLTIAEGADISVTSICLVNSGDNSNNGIFNINGTLTVTSECDSDCYAPRASHKGILFGHYYGGSTVTVGETGSLIGEYTWIQMTYTATSSLIIDGGTVKVLGLNIGSQNNTPVVVQNGGTLALKDGLVQQNHGIYLFDGGTIEAWGDDGLDWTPNTTAIGNGGLTVAGTKVTLSGALTGNGNISVGDATTLGLGLSRPTNTFIFAGETDVIYTEKISDDGVVYQLKLDTSSETPNYRVYGVDGTEKTITEGQYDVTVTGKTALYAWEFNGSLDSVGQKTDAMGKDHGPFYTDDNEAVYAYSQPYASFTWPDESTTAIACTLPTNANVCLVGFGQATPGGIALTAGDVTKNEVKLVYWQYNQPYTVLTTMKVPNAYDYEHLYLVTKTADSVKVYLDGTLVASYSGALSLGKGIQVGTVFQGVGQTGLIRLDDVYSGTNDCKSVVNAIRIYDTILGPNAVAALKEEFKYVSPNGSFSRTLPSEAEAFWAADGQWVNDATQETVSKPDAESAVTLTGVTTTSVKVNLAEDTTYESLTLNGDADSALTIQAGGFESLPGKIRADGLVTVNAPVILDYTAIDIAGVPLTVTENGAITFDLVKFPFNAYYADTYVPLTGVSEKYEGQMFAALPEETPGRTVTFGYDESTQTYGITIAVEDHPFVYNMGWTWNDEDVTAEIVSNNTAQAIIVQSNLEWPIDRSGITVEAGTLTVTAVTKRAADVTVEADAVLDLNGNQAKEMALTLNGGKVTYGNTKLGEADQIKELTLTADSEINTPVKGQIYAQSYNTATTIALGTHTLTKTGEDVLQVVNVDITGTGTIDIQEGEFYGSENTRAATTTFKIAAGATLHNRGGKTMTIAKIVGEGGTLNNEGTISAFDLSGTLTIANAGTFGTITNAAGAVVNVGTKHNLTFAGAGTVNAVLTDAQIAQEGPITIFTKAEGATTVGGTVLDKDNNPVPGNWAGGSFQVDHEAKIGTTYYLTFDAALEAAEADETVTLLKDVTTAKAQQWTIAKNITLDFGTSKITKTVANDWVFTIADGAEVIFTGSTGGIVHKPAALEQKSPASMIQIIGKLTVNGGVYESDYTVFKTDDIGTQAGELVVNGGTVTITPEQKYTGLTFAVMNWCTTTINGGTFNGNVVALSYQDQPYPSVVTIDGGTVTSACFYQNGASDTEVGTIKVAEGLSVVPTIMKGVEGNVVTSTTEAGYTVYTLTKGEAKIGTKYYLTFAEALEAAQADETVTLCKDVTTAEAATFTIAKNIMVDFDDYTITKTVANDWVFQIAKGADVTFKGGKGGIVHYPAVLNPVNPASMIQILGKLTVAGGAYKSDYTIFKVDEDDKATHTAKGELVVNAGTFTIEPQPETTYAGKTYAVMNWSKATLSGGTFTGTIATLSDDGNACSQAGETIVDGTIDGTPVYTLQVMGSTYKNVPKIKGVEIDNVKLVQSASITDTLELVVDGEYVTVQKKSSGPVTPGQEIVVPTGKTQEEFMEDINTNAAYKAQYLKAPDGAETTGLYLDCFSAVPAGEKVAFELNETGTNMVEIATVAVETTALEVVFSKESTLTIAEPLTGFYYSLKQGGDVKDLGFNDPGDQDKLAGKDTIKFTLKKPENAGFYQTIITPVPTKVIENAGAHFRF